MHLSLSTTNSAPAHLFFLLNTPATPEIYTLSLHDALPIHKFANPSFKVFGNGVNEAVTQYFTNYVLREYGLSSGQGHAEKVVVAEALAATVGFEELALAYFLGPPDKVLEILKNKIPGFDHIKVLEATKGKSVDWKKVAEMFQVPP